MIFKIFSWEK